MKKVITMLMAIVTSVAMSAQALVWDGSAEPWTHGSGTHDDPYLIETPQQLAFLAQTVNESYDFADYRFTDTCFLMTADFDLGGDLGLDWAPIGASPSHGSNRTMFAGDFDGGNHVVSNMRITTENYINAYGLFGLVSGSLIENVSLDGSCAIQLESINEYWEIVIGGLVSYIREGTVRNCHSFAVIECNRLYGDMYGCYIGGVCGMLRGSLVDGCTYSGEIISDASTNYGQVMVGGIVGEMIDSKVTDCHNSGSIYNNRIDPLYSMMFSEVDFCSGGVVGSAIGENKSEILYCSNTGTVSVFIEEEPEHQQERYFASGGILGSSMGFNAHFVKNKIEIRSCYNVGDVSVDVAGTGLNESACGILGVAYINDTVTVVSCYSAGTLMGDAMGGIMVTESEKITVTNSYYLESEGCDNGYGEPKTEEYMKTEEFVEVLNESDPVYSMDYTNENGGFPVFVNQYDGEPEAVGASNQCRAYPNPSGGMVSVVLPEGASGASVELFSLDGRLVMSEPWVTGGIDISRLATGIYIMRVATDNGVTFEEKVVRE